MSPWLNPSSLRWKFMFAPVVGTVLITVLALVLIRSTSEDLEKLERLHTEEAAVGDFLTRIGDDLAISHGLIYQLLLSVDGETDEGELHDQSKPLLYRLLSIEERIEAELLAGTLQPDETELVERVLDLLEYYRVNASNAFLVATVDPGQARRVMTEASTYFNGLNSLLFNVSNIIGGRLDQRLAAQGKVMQRRADMLAVLFFAAALGMLFIGFALSLILTRDLRAVTSQLESLLDKRNDPTGLQSRRRMVVDTLRLTVAQVRENYASLERTQKDLEESNDRLSKSLDLVAERERSLESVNAELKNTVARQDGLIRAQQEAEKARDVALVAAERANAAKSDFLANMSHELRTPLNAIIGFSDMIKSAVFGPVDNKYREYASDIGMAGEHLHDLVTDVLDIARIEAGELDVSREHVEMAEIVDACETMLRMHAENAGVDLDVEIPSTMPLLITDPFRFRQILINLMDNAIKFTPRGGEVKVSGVVHDDGRVALTVRDSGVGIAKEDIPKALEKFGQIRTGHEYAHSGAGVGLSIVKLLVEMLEGELQIDSVIGQGTTVSVTLPRHLTYIPPGRDASLC